MKFLNLLIISPALFFGNNKSSDRSTEFSSDVATHFYSKEKVAAFSILYSKCNRCHAKRNKRKVFTLENMDGLADKINEQVFVKKRMPKGNSIKLSQEDSKKLQNWLNTLK